MTVDVAIIDTESSNEVAESQSIEAIRAGCDVVYQARLVLPPFIGIADFLVHPRVAARITGEPEAAAAMALSPPSASVPYEAWDAKLSHSAKPSHLVQLCAYVEMLEAIARPRAEQLVVALGSGEFFRGRVADSFYYFLSAKRAFLAAMDAYDETRCPLPDANRKHGRWGPAAMAELEKRDHTTRVARLNRSQSQKLAKVGIDTLAALADSTLTTVPGMAAIIRWRTR